MYYLVETFALTAALYALSYALGAGLSALLFRDRAPSLQPFVTPWIGLAQTGIFMSFLGMLGLGSGLACGLAFALAAAAWFFGTRRLPRLSTEKSSLPMAALVLLATALFMLPGLGRTDRVTAFTRDNLDPVAYAVATRGLEEGGPLARVRQARERGENWKKISDIRQLEADTLALARWIPLYDLSFFCKVLGRDPVELFSLFACFLLALSFQALWGFLRVTLAMRTTSALMAFLLCALNPHLLYLTQHGFLPQIMANGFFLCFLCVAGGSLGTSEVFSAETALAGILLAAVLGTYPELFPFVVLGIILHLAWISASEKSWLANLKKGLALGAVAGALSPYQVYASLASVSWTHEGGWPVTSSRYFLPFQLGVYHPGPVMEPLLWAECSVGLLLAALVLRGIWVSPSRRLLLSAWLPFFGVGIFTAAMGWNYKHFKSFTYGYFLVPVILAQGIGSLKEWRLEKNTPLRKLVVWGSLIVVFWVMAFAAKNSARHILFLHRQGQFAPASFSELEDIGKAPELDGIAFQGMTFWETDWAIYRLPGKKAGVPYYEPGLITDEIGSPADPKYKYLFYREGLETVLEPAGGRTTGRVIFSSNGLSLKELSAPESAYPSAVLFGQGFHGLQNDGSEEWVWMDREAELIIHAQASSSVLEGEAESGRSQILACSVNGKETGAAFLKGGGRENFSLPFNLAEGENKVRLRLAGSRDAVTAPSSLRFFRIRLAPREAAK